MGLRDRRRETPQRASAGVCGDRFLARAADREQPPVARDSLQLVNAAVLELEPRACNEILHGAGDPAIEWCAANAPELPFSLTVGLIVPVTETKADVDGTTKRRRSLGGQCESHGDRAFGRSSCK